MILGIAGHEAAKFTAETERQARVQIREFLILDSVTKVVSGACHLGGIDVWAIEEAKKFGIPTEEFPPANRSWEGYKARNILIAETSNKVISLVVKTLPAGYTGMRFKLCYHCKTSSHVKSGGCWTAHYAARLGKEFQIVEI